MWFARKEVVLKLWSAWIETLHIYVAKKPHRINVTAQMSTPKRMWTLSGDDSQNCGVVPPPTSWYGSHSKPLTLPPFSKSCMKWFVFYWWVFEVASVGNWIFDLLEFGKYILSVLSSPGKIPPSSQTLSWLRRSCHLEGILTPHPLPPACWGSTSSLSRQITLCQLVCRCMHVAHAADTFQNSNTSHRPPINYARANCSLI